MSGPTGLSMVALAFDGLRRKPGRNLLTMSGVFIGVMALTLIVALGDGIQKVITATVSDQTNLRQIGLSGGTGNRLDEGRDVVIEDVEDERQARMRRAALARRRAGTFIGRRAQTLDQATLDQLATLPHVESIKPILLERYKVKSGTHDTEATPTLGVDVDRRRYADRILAGRYFTGPGANEVLIHEFLAYRWGYKTVAELQRLVGQPLELTTLGRDEMMGGGMADQIVEDVLSDEMIEGLTEEEQAALPGIIAKAMAAFRGGSFTRDGPDTGPQTYPMTIVGVIRELEETDNFNVIEDGNAFQVDVFLPETTARRMYLDSPVNQAIGYARALVMVDQPSNAKEVEDALRDAGYTAFSVAQVISRVESTVGVLTVIIGFLTSIALLVAALGIVNTMVTSVLERTSEIGLWKAIGATDGQVRAVFLLEAALIGLLGGLLGLGIALLLMIPGEAVAKTLISERALFPVSTSVFSVPAWLPFAGPALATVVAMLASLYPAWRAARVDPVRALRHD